MKVTQSQLRRALREMLLEQSHVVAGIVNTFSADPKYQSFISDIIGDGDRISVFQSAVQKVWRDPKTQESIDKAAAWSMVAARAAATLGAPGLAVAATTTSGIAAALSLADELGFGTEKGNIFRVSTSKAGRRAAVRNALVDTALIYSALVETDKIQPVSFLDELMGSTLAEIEDNVDEQLQAFVTEAGMFDRDQVLKLVCRVTAEGDLLAFEQAKSEVVVFINSQIDAAGDGPIASMGTAALRDELSWLESLTPESCQITEKRLSQLIREELARVTETQQVLTSPFSTGFSAEKATIPRPYINYRVDGSSAPNQSVAVRQFEKKILAMGADPDDYTLQCTPEAGGWQCVASKSHTSSGELGLTFPGEEGTAEEVNERVTLRLRGNSDWQGWASGIYEAEEEEEEEEENLEDHV